MLIIPTINLKVVAELVTPKTKRVTVLVDDKYITKAYIFPYDKRITTRRGEQLTGNYKRGIENKGDMNLRAGAWHAMSKARSWRL